MWSIQVSWWEMAAEVLEHLLEVSFMLLIENVEDFALVLDSRILEVAYKLLMLYTKFRVNI